MERDPLPAALRTVGLTRQEVDSAGIWLAEGFRGTPDCPNPMRGFWDAPRVPLGYVGSVRSCQQRKAV